MSRKTTCHSAPLSLRSPNVKTNKTLLALSIPGMLLSPMAMAQEDEPMILTLMPKLVRHIKRKFLAIHVT